MKTIATVRNGYKTKFGVPRQSGLTEDMESVIVFEPEYRNEDALRGIEEYSHLWIIWRFSDTEREGFKPTVRPPRLGGNKRVGVFATRSPFRPNPIGLSSVRLIAVEKTKNNGTVLKVAGADMMDGTQILDIKPYVRYSDCHEDAVCSFADSYSDRRLKVELEDGILADGEFIKLLISVLQNDPKPSYHGEGRVYGLELCGKEIKFTYIDDIIKVIDIIDKA